MRGMSSADDFRDFYVNRDVAQLVARTAGGREVASSSLVIPTSNEIIVFYEPCEGFI